mmetsp:Transcript_64449/g.153820  ORF Transcript_64449/g.153820 Transcript_64449/m.153820 type:complete len:207 (-) Transcript_64449:1466-2086(-)
MSSRTSARGKVMGNMPFLKQLLKKMSAKLVEIRHRMPWSNNAQGACSRDEPQPKLSPQTRMLDLRYGCRFRTNSGSSVVPSGLYRISKKALLPKPVRLIVLRNCLGMIMSVSTFCMSRGAGTPFNVVNFGIPAEEDASDFACDASVTVALNAGAGGTGSVPTKVSQAVIGSSILAASPCMSSRTSVSFPVTAAAAAMAGLMRCVRP